MEFVYVVPRSELFPECTPHGFQAFAADSDVEAGSESPRRADVVEVVRERGFYVEREIAERTPEWKQIIPYVVVVRTGEHGEPEVFMLRRTQNGGEARLHDKLSIGVGGHINPIDSFPENGETAAESDAGRRPDPIPAACRRELHEELILDGELEPVSVGLLNDDTNPVGAVHIGLVEVVHVDGDVAVRETDQLEGCFTRLSHLEAMLERGAPFESWSALLLLRLSSLLESLDAEASNSSRSAGEAVRTLDPSGAGR